MRTKGSHRGLGWALGFVVVLSATLLAPAARADTLIDFDDRDPGPVTNEYGDRGVWFESASGPYIAVDVAAHSAPNVLRSASPGHEFDTEPLTIHFTSPQRQVGFFAVTGGSAIEEVVRAYDQEGQVVAQNGPRTAPSGELTTHLQVTSQATDIMRVEFEEGVAGIEIIDDLEFLDATETTVTQSSVDSTVTQSSVDSTDVTSGTTGGASTLAKCALTARDASGFQVTPSEGEPGTQVHIAAEISREFAACPLSILFGGSRFGGDATIGPDGGISESRTVPHDARAGTTSVELATTGGLVLAEASFEVLAAPQGPAERPLDLDPLWLLAGAAALLLLVLAVAALVRARALRQRRWVRQHVRAEPHPSRVDVTVERDPNTAPTLTVRLQPHDDAGTQTVKEGT
jgi:hypothetical protein